MPGYAFARSATKTTDMDSTKEDEQETDIILAISVALGVLFSLGIVGVLIYCCVRVRGAKRNEAQARSAPPAWPSAARVNQSGPLNSSSSVEAGPRTMAQSAETLDIGPTEAPSQLEAETESEMNVEKGGFLCC